MSDSWARLALVAIVASVATYAAPRWWNSDALDVAGTTHIVQIKPAREIVVQKMEVLIHGSATRPAMIGDASRVHYLARANVRYSVDLKQAKLSYQDASPSGILTVRVPDVKAEAFIITDTKEKISSLSLLATEGGTGNELELKADAALQRRADADARRPDNLEAARKAALFEIKNLYEDALRATGSPARVNVVMPNARST